MIASRRAFAVTAVAAFVLASCKGKRADSELQVFAAASLREAFTEIGAAFEKAHPGRKVTFQFAGSQELRAQIEHGARADVFASADSKHMTALVDSGAMTAPVVFARNEPVVIVARDRSSQIPLFTDLATAQRIVVGAPEVPIGRYTVQILERVEQQLDPALRQAIESRIASRELNVRQVLAKVSLGEADAGIVYRTDAVTAADKIAVLEIPPAVNVVAEYPIAAATTAPNAALAREWIALVQSPAGQDVLRRRGFLPGAAAPPGATTP